MQKKNHAALAARLARIEGQLAGVRSALEADDCSKAARTLLAAAKSLDSARIACAQEFLTERVYKNVQVKDPSLLRDVQQLIKA